MNYCAHPQTEYAATLLECIWPGIEWLDIGCGRQVVPDWVWTTEQASELLCDVNLTGLDVDEAIDDHPLLKARLRCLAENIPVPDNSFDLVTANMMMEHVREPGLVLHEVRRALRPGGCFLIHTPNRRYYLYRIARWVPQVVKNRVILWLENRKESDIFPTFYRFNTIEAVRAFADQARFQIQSLHFAGPTPSFLNTPFEKLERPIIRMLRRPEFERYRPSLIVKLRKPRD